VHTETRNRELVESSEVVVLAVKPQVIREVARDLAEAVQTRRPLVISVAAGVRAADLQRWLGGNCALVRCMPNTPALVQSGATALFATETVSDSQKDVAESILRAVGLALWIESEDLMDAVTALSGSGPAYFLLVMEALQEAGEALGLSHKTAHLLSLQTAFGAAKMALESSEDVAALRQQVTSPGGTTERALAVLEDGGLRELFNQALTAARDRSRELAEQLGAA
jgi:pyrroline-5-carboxylate reductase